MVWQAGSRALPQRCGPACLPQHAPPAAQSAGGRGTRRALAALHRLHTTGKPRRLGEVRRRHVLLEQGKLPGMHDLDRRRGPPELVHAPAPIQVVKVRPVHPPRGRAIVVRQRPQRLPRLDRRGGSLRDQAPAPVAMHHDAKVVPAILGSLLTTRGHPRLNIDWPAPHVLPIGVPTLASPQESRLSAPMLAMARPGASRVARTVALPLPRARGLAQNGPGRWRFTVRGAHRG